MAFNEKTYYRIAYLLSTNENISDVFYLFSDKITCEELDIMIYFGLTSDDIRERYMDDLSYNDKKCIMKIADMLYDQNSPNFKVFLQYCYDYAYEVYQKYHVDGGNDDYQLRKRIFDHDPELLTSTYYDPYYYFIALDAENYALADIISKINPGCAARGFREGKRREVKINTIPLKHFLMIDESMTDLYFDEIYTYGRVDLLMADNVCPGMFFSTKNSYKNMSLEAFRYIRSKATITVEACCDILLHSSHLFSEMILDKKFIDELDKHYILFLHHASENIYSYAVEYIIEKYRDKIEQKINDGSLLLVYPYAIDKDRGTFSTGFLTCLDIYDFPRTKMYPYSKNHVDSNEITIMGINISVIKSFIELPEKMFISRLMAMMVMYSDGYFRVREFRYLKRYQRFFEIVAQLPLALQSIIAFRYLRLATCQMILLKNSDFYYVLSIV